MYLKSLKLVGFKSFADRTRLELRPGVTVIVGPNGSGKSNLVDAVSWVLGTQSAKSLRTPKMEDVVFAGTATRPALNRAEVSLVFDNESRTLPLDLDEVSFTRRLYRDGSSDYELNGVACRLLDIQELLSDSGVGRHQHVIVGQGQIDSVLNSGPEDHRAVIEEAAGILKHRQRKERALRRLERTDADLVRVEDIVNELVRQMRPLKRQAQAAEQHAELVAGARDLRLYLGGRRLRHLEERAQTVAQERLTLAQQIADGEVEVGELGSALNILTRESGEVGAALDRDTSAAARLETIIEKLRRSASVAQERHRAAEARRDGAEERMRDMNTELAELESDVGSVEATVADMESQVAGEERRFRAMEDEARSLADQESLTPEGALVVVRGEVRSLESADQRDQRELDQVDHRSAVIESQISDDGEEIKRVNAEILSLDEEAARLQHDYDSAAAARKLYQERWEAIESALSEARLEAATADARREAVAGAVIGAVDPDARELAVTAGGHRGTLGALLDIPVDLAAPVDAALGPWADASVFGSVVDRNAAVAAVKSGGRGGVPVVSVAASQVASARSVAAQAGVEALVDRLGPDADPGLAAGLLGDVVLVEGWTMAADIVARHPELRAVTPEGDLISANGIRVAQPDGATPAMLEAAEVAQEQANTELARVESLHTTTRRDFERSRQAEREALEALEAIEARMSGASENLGRLNRAKSNLEGERARLEDRRRALREGLEERRSDLARLAQRLQALEGEDAERQRAWEEMAARRKAVEEQREAARASWQQAAAELRATKERLGLLETRRQTVVANLTSDLSAPVTEQDLERLSLVHQTSRRAIDVIGTRLQELRERQADLRSRAGVTGTQRDSVRARHEAARSDLEAARKRLSEIDVESAEIRVRRENIAESLRRDEDVDEGVALSAPRPEIDGAESDEDLRSELESLEARLRRMGPVNPLAAEEYGELEQRHDFLAAQLADLESSRDDLKQVISALDEEIQGRFTAAFDEVAVAFADHFAVLFPGGAGRLAMTDPSDPLTSGVEIQAQPLGKKVNQLSLLSGGERSLAALAFLFAVFKARPSPFYVLDEVEAALDDANLRRFMRLVEAFRADAQLVIVTHQQQTMESANVLYGVTMEPGGSSAVVRKELVAANLHPAGSEKAGATA